jgi:uncharacterized coiled-coil protein SlyX
MQLRRSKQQTPEDRLKSLETRVTHLEAMIEGLQDAVHREAVRASARLDEMERNIEPAELSRRISKDARERGL